ncbi:MAG: 6,7-dimethyl-8-ribityllumazine synthase [Alphaproteobacteria bacterium]
MTKIAIVEARFYPELADELAAGAIAAIEARGMQFERLTVPGALEVPQAVALAQLSGKFAGAVALGCVIRGETGHYDIVADTSARALMDIAVTHNFPVGNGILTVDNSDQAWVRARTDNTGGKGAAAAGACLDLVEIAKGLQQS